MSLFVLALLVLVAGGGAALAAGRRARLASALGAGSAVAGAALGLVPTLAVLAGGETRTLVRPWSLPGGSLSLAIDPLSAFFLVPVFGISAVVAVYGASYLAEHAPARRLGPVWLWFDLLVASMALVVAAGNALLFLVGWEAMALASYFLIVFHHEREDVQRAGWIYLGATHLGTAFAMALFAWLGHEAGSLDMSAWRVAPEHAGWLFALALVAFGSKAGLFPMHVWLPEAHPVAPSHVSALLSGVMIKVGIYALLRVLLVLGEPAAAWGIALVALGLASGVLGIASALVQRDLKRVLAYSSVENVGLIALGVGLALLARHAAAPALAAWALAGALLHVWSHGLMKTLLFLAAGSIGRATGTLDLERLGGLVRRMPVSAGGMLLGAAAICALPPLGGFASELPLYAASLRGVAERAQPLAVFLVAIAGLGLVGGLAAACFVRAAGVALLGEPRSRAAAEAVEAPPGMRAAIVLLAVACAVFGLASPLMLSAAAHPVAQLLGDGGATATALASLASTLSRTSAAGAGVVAAVGLLALVRRRLLHGRRVASGPTWDCGYAEPTSRMQYTASSFSQPLAELLAPALRVRIAEEPPDGRFPRAASLRSRPGDLASELLFEPLFRGVAALALRLRGLQSGSTHLYVLYVLLAAVALLTWRFG